MVLRSFAMQGVLILIRALVARFFATNALIRGLSCRSRSIGEWFFKALYKSFFYSCKFALIRGQIFF